MQNKRGQGLSTNAIILIVLGVIVLVLLAIGFMMGWGSIAPWLSSENVDTIVNSCSTACSTQSTYSYCTKARELNTDEETLKDVNCNFLAQIKPIYGVEECGLNCQNIPSSATNLEEAKKDCKGEPEGTVIEYLANNKLETYPCDEADIAGLKLCENVCNKGNCPGDKVMTGRFEGVDSATQVCCEVDCT